MGKTEEREKRERREIYTRLGEEPGRAINMMVKRRCGGVPGMRVFIDACRRGPSAGRTGVSGGGAGGGGHSRVVAVMRVVWIMSGHCTFACAPVLSAVSTAAAAETAAGETRGFSRTQERTHSNWGPVSGL